MLTALLKGNSWFIFKVGMPLVFLYHLALANPFFNTAAEDAKGLEKWGNTCLSPVRFLCEGKKALVVQGEEDPTYELVREFSYGSHFFLKTAVSWTLLPYSLPIGAILKGLSYFSPVAREHAHRIRKVLHAIKIMPNHSYYHSIGMEVNDYRSAEFIAPPGWKRHLKGKNRLEPDIKALTAIVTLLSKHNIPFWLDCGSLLGTYQYGGAIPGDWDIDVAIPILEFENAKKALQELDPQLAIVQDWSGRANPKSYLKVYVHESGNMIDLYHFAIDEENKQIHTLLSNEGNIFLSKEWKERERRYTAPMPFSYVFPLKKAFFEGIEVPVPGNVEKYLAVFYGENLAPAKIYNERTQEYEKDPTHSYWQLSDH